MEKRSVKYSINTKLYNLTIMNLQNRSVVITGSGSGIGRACALGFAKEGASIVIADIQPDAAEETVRQIKAVWKD